MLVALSTLEESQSIVAEDNNADVEQLLDYCATHKNTKLCYHNSDMTLCIHSNSSYLTEMNARSRSGGIFSLGLNEFNNTKETNGYILTPSNIMKHVMSSEVEAEGVALFHTAKSSELIKTTLEEMEHLQAAIHTQMGNSTTDCIINRRL